MSEISHDEIFRGAWALREHQMVGRFTRDFDEIPRGQQRKWLDAAEVVLRAAYNQPE